MKGSLEFFGVDIFTGERILFQRVPNTILNNMYTQIAKSLGGVSTAFINRMQFGTGTDNTDPTQAILQTPITPVKAVTPSIDAVNYLVTYTAYLESTEGNGFPISEAGLLCYDGTLVARTTFSARTKVRDFQFGFSWTIAYKSA